MVYTITFPAKYRCLDCRDLFHDPKVTYYRRGKWYYRHERCPSCSSRKIEELGFLLPKE